MTQAYVYKWTHTPSLRWYVGSRTRQGCHPNDGYICSSRTVKPLIQANPEEWTRTIIATGTPEDMLDLELEILDLFDALTDPRSLNQSSGWPKGVLGMPKTDEHKEKLRRINLGKRHTDAAREKMKAKRALQTSSGWRWTEESKSRVRGQPKLRCSCLFCKREMIVQALGRYHKHCNITLVSENPNESTKENK